MEEGTDELILGFARPPKEMDEEASYRAIETLRYCLADEAFAKAVADRDADGKPRHTVYLGPSLKNSQMTGKTIDNPEFSTLAEVVAGESRVAWQAFDNETALRLKCFAEPMFAPFLWLETVLVDVFPKSIIDLLSRAYVARVLNFAAWSPAPCPPIGLISNVALFTNCDSHLHKDSAMEDSGISVLDYYHVGDKATGKDVTESVPNLSILELMVTLCHRSGLLVAFQPHLHHQSVHNVKEIERVVGAGYGHSKVAVVTKDVLDQMHNSSQKSIGGSLARHQEAVSDKSK
jgi:hypothetical protein